MYIVSFSYVIFIVWQVVYLHTLDKAVCPFLQVIKHFDMPKRHPTDKKTLDTLLEAQVEM